MRIFWLTLLWLFATPALAASFNCSAGSLNATEQLICDTPTLGQLDIQLAKQFKATQKVMDKSTLRASQIQWIKLRQRSCEQQENRDEHVDCLANSLQQRTMTLSTWATLVQQPQRAVEYEEILHSQPGTNGCSDAASTYDIKRCQHKTHIFLEDTMALYLLAAKEAAQATEKMYRTQGSEFYSAAKTMRELEEIQQRWQSYAQDSCGFWTTANPQGTLYPVMANSCLANSYVERLALIYAQILGENQRTLPKVF